MGHRILLIEDDLSICEMVGDHLKKEGFLVAQEMQVLITRFFDLAIRPLLPGCWWERF